MPAYRYIDDFCPKDTYKLGRNIPSTPEGATIIQAWWTVKESETDIDSNAIFSLTIGTAETSSGIVTNYVDGTARVLFIAQPSNSELMQGNATYYYDIQVKLDTNEIYTIELGKLFSNRVITGSA